jgi:hypothetical protein
MDWIKVTKHLEHLRPKLALSLRVVMIDLIKLYTEYWFVGSTPWPWLARNKLVLILCHTNSSPQ